MLDLHSKQYKEIVRLLSEGRQTILLIGDEGVGKRTLIQRIMMNRDDFRVTVVNELNIEVARAMKAASLRKYIQKQLYLIDGDKASNQAYNALLKLLEEPPRDSVYIITVSKAPLPTIVSRCNTVLIPPLTRDELLGVLVEKGMSERAVSSIIQYAHGSVTEALKAYEKFEEKRRLAPFINALVERDQAFVLLQVRKITKEDIAILVELCEDVMLSAYGLMNPELSSIVTTQPSILLRIKEALLAGHSPSIGWLRAWFELERN